MLVGVVGKHELTVFQVIYHLLGNFLTHRRTAKTATQSTMLFNPFWGNIIGAMDDDGSLSRRIIDPIFEAIKAKRVAVLALVGFCCPEKPEAGLMTTFNI